MKINVTQFIKEFGLNCTLKMFSNYFMFKLTKNNKFLQKYLNVISQYVEDNYANIMTEEYASNKTIVKPFKIWMLWWQGIDDNTPKIVQSCIKSVKENFPENEIIIITKNNYMDYIQIPDYILEKVNKGYISITHLSDIIRFCLLSEYGGMWLDATIFIAKRFDKEISKYEFYTNKLPCSKEYQQFVSKARWSGFFIYCKPGNPIVTNLKNVLFQYWKEHNKLITYLFIDHIFDVCYKKFPKLREMFDKVPINNINIYTMANKLFEKYDKDTYANYLNDTNLFKLTYKFEKEKADIANTNYQFIINK